MRTILLVIGYILAVPPLLVIVPALKQPAAPMKRLGLKWPWRVALASELSGALLITLGWLRFGNTGAVVINGSWSVILVGLWVRGELKTTKAS